MISDGKRDTISSQIAFGRGLYILTTFVMIIVKANYLIPSPEDNCIENGAIAVTGTKISRIGSFDDVKGLPDIERIFDLGNAVILPGLINTHTHLDLTAMQNHIKPTGNFTHWVFQLVGARMRWKDEDYISSIEKGIELCIEGGTTTVADITNTGHSFTVLKESPLRKVIYKEIIGLDSNLSDEMIKILTEEVSSIAPDHLLHIGLSPHAPYSVSKKLYQSVSRLALEKSLPICTHIAETRDEIEFLLKGTGAFSLLLQKLHALPDNWKPPGITPIQFLHETGILNARLNLIHANYTTDEEIALIQSTGASVVFCPKSHQFFGHTNYPVHKYLGAGINVSLGTDSLASNDSLQILDEMKHLYSHYSVPPETILSMATIHAAKALYMDAQIGQLKENFEADLCGIMIPEGDKGPIYQRLLDPSSKNIFTMIAGVVCYNALGK
ncbi:MAG: amidohydrolase family protein [Candidatus Brocadiaceae bacterium]|nr:amidohydrolase family protein [Candidatus Brocadiaceae bacterium]